jgi:hypothetical protein
VKIILIIVALVVVGMALDWFKAARLEQERKVAETAASEKPIVRHLERGKTDVARIAVHEYKQALLMHRINKGTYPPNMQALVDSGYLPSGSDLDPFGQRYELQYVGKQAIISSPGSDHVRGTPDDIVERIGID